MSSAENQTAVPRPAVSGKAVASLVLGLLSFCVPVVLAIPGIILAVLGLRDIKSSQGRLTGRGLAIAGIVTGIVGNVAIALAVVFGLLPAVQETANQKQCMINLLTIVRAMHNYHDTLGSFPPSVASSKEGKPLHSWRVLLLPFLHQKKLYEQFKLDEPWDSPANQALLSKMPKEYAPPGENFPPDDGGTHIMVFTGKDAPFDPGEPPKWLGDPMYKGVLESMQLRFDPPLAKPLYCFGKRPYISSFVDGTMNTILLVEADERVPWTKPQDLPYHADQPLPKLGGLHRNRFFVALVDGTVRSVSNKTSEATIRAAITPNGGEIMGPDWNPP
jgi:hypothetical protein